MFFTKNIIDQLDRALGVKKRRLRDYTEIEKLSFSAMIITIFGTAIINLVTFP